MNRLRQKNMQSGDYLNQRSRKFQIVPLPFRVLELRIANGEARRIDLEEIDAEIARSSVDMMPASVRSLQDQLLNGQVSNAGRPCLAISEKRQFGCLAQLIYTHLRMALAGKPDALSVAVSFVEEHRSSYQQDLEDHYDPYVAAWRLVSVWLFGTPDRHKRLSNLASAANTHYGRPR